MSHRLFSTKNLKPKPLPDTPEARASYDAFLLEIAASPAKFDQAVEIVTQILRNDKKANRKKARKQ